MTAIFIVFELGCDVGFNFAYVVFEVTCDITVGLGCDVGLANLDTYRVAMATRSITLHLWDPNATEFV